jgi:hypothetical protein
LEIVGCKSTAAVHFYWVGINQLECVDAVRSSAQGFDRLSPNGWFKFKGADPITAFLPHSSAMGLQIRQKLSSLGPIFAFDAPSPTGS